MLSILLLSDRLSSELEVMQPEDLGKVDTFRREEAKILESAIEELLVENWTKVLDWSESRTETSSFWLKRDRSRRTVWSLVKIAATLGQAIYSDRQYLKNVDSLTEAMDYYTAKGYQIDKIHRHFEQKNFLLLETTLPYYARLVEIKSLFNN